ncbi:ligand-dependent nuclear receptor-interacting factor 1 isoform X2 [Apus apus]|nr:ligand-dependent nuclear receptor-interacting factor 1 isoform X2 [Apus apus]XP_051495142.1 ligand-dependent nuclear receptor-interacting factor 1 isoform X2 [Apus apus]XP_051495143.1 ligand-dependent nuclear receptor-interacting factor 1 isoform X2 [Apus apus]XP_051495144.1 ligand-dependent nuclear receptor-interacting factor 1 isoform X2 [Apus apus]XP_051495145.1 ligand-dependent nuclear receptor-interacting factor 1 isoform X2 [Apus apus]
MYRVVQTTGPDGKNLLRLLPISKSSGSFVPIVQSSVMPNHSKANISNPVHLTFKTQLANTTAPSSVKIPAFQSPNPGKILLTRTLDKQEGGRAGSEKESLSPKSGAAIQSSCVSVDRLSVQNMAVTSSSNQGKTAYMLVNTKTLPVNVKPSVLPSGHHLQIPADAEVKSVPASFLPSAIQQKILAAAATNMSGGADSTKMPTVICVTPVNTVKTVVPKHLQPICPKPAPEVSKSVIMTAAQKGNGSSPETVTPDGQQCQQTPMKWIVQESPQSPAARLIPVRSSSNMATKILKTLSEMKNIEINSPNILSLCSGGPGGSQTKITPIKDNALVMYNGRVFLLTRRGSDVLSGQVDKQASSSSDALIKKETSKLIDSSAVKKITNKVVNLVLSKNKGMVLSQNDPKPVTNSKHSPPTGFRNDLKPAALLTSSANQQNSTVNQRKSLPLSESISSGMTPVPAVGKQEHPSPNGKEKCHSPKAASAVFPQFKQDCSFSEDWQKIQCEKMHPPGKLIPNKEQEKPHWKQYLELRKKFGLFKEERVYLKRIPLRTSCEKPEERVCSSNSLKRRNDSCSSSSLDVEINQLQECVKEEKVIVKLEEDLTKKRKIKSSPQSDSGKRRRTSVKATTSPSPENTSSSSSLHRDVSPPPVFPQQSISTDLAPSSLGRDLQDDPHPQYSHVTDSSFPVLVSCEGDTSVLEGSFRDDTFPWTPPDLDETIRDEKIKRLKQLLREREAALEEMRRKMQQS